MHHHHDALLRRVGKDALANRRQHLVLFQRLREVVRDAENSPYLREQLVKHPHVQRHIQPRHRVHRVRRAEPRVSIDRFHRVLLLVREILHRRRLELRAELRRLHAQHIRREDRLLQLLDALARPAAHELHRRPRLAELVAHVPRDLVHQRFFRLFLVPNLVLLVPHDKKRMLPLVAPLLQIAEQNRVGVVKLPLEHEKIKVVLLRVELLDPPIHGKARRAVPRQVVDAQRAERCLLHIHRRIGMHARLKQFPSDQFIDKAGLSRARLTDQRDMDFLLQLPFLLFPFRLHFLFQIHAASSLASFFSS